MVPGEPPGSTEVQPGTGSTCPHSAVLCVGSRDSLSACTESGKHAAVAVR